MKIAIGAGLLTLLSTRALGGDEQSARQDTVSALSDTTSIEQVVDEQWLNTIWTQVDDLVQTHEYKLQETITVAGVRGAEAEDAILDKLYFKGSKRYPSQERLELAVNQLRGMYQDKATTDKDRVLFFMGQCYERLGMKKEAVSAYRDLVRNYQTPWAVKGAATLRALEEAK